MTNCRTGPFEMSGGEIYGCRGGGYYGVGNLIMCVRTDSMTMSGGWIHDNKCPEDGGLVSMEIGNCNVTGGRYTNNNGYVFRTAVNGDSPTFSGGTFEGNNGAIYAISYKEVRLKGKEA